MLTLLYERSLLEPFDRRFRFFFSIESQCQRVPFKVRALRERLAVAEEPVFAFAPFLLPHPPHVFDADGNCITEAGVGRSSYLEQLRYANKEIIALVDAIRKGARRPTIVVLQADEGPYPSRYGENDDDVDWTVASEQELRLKTGILNAVYFPRQDYRSLATDVTPVNTFRQIFNRYFGTTLPLLPDRTFAHRDEAHIFDFHDITAKVRLPRLARGGNLTDSSSNDLASSKLGRP